MEVSQNNNDGGVMEGWLYLIRSNRFGLQYSRKRYFVLEDHFLRSFKSVPDSKTEVFFCSPFFCFYLILMWDLCRRKSSVWCFCSSVWILECDAVQLKFRIVALLSIIWELLSCGMELFMYFWLIMVWKW